MAAIRGSVGFRYCTFSDIDRNFSRELGYFDSRLVVRSKRMTEHDFKRLAENGISVETVPAMSSASALRMLNGDVGAVVMRDFHGHDTAMASLIIEAAGGSVA